MAQSATAAVSWRETMKLDPARRWRFLTQHRRWPEIELRLRHRWNPYELVDWHRREFKDDKPISVGTLYRYLAEQPSTWFIEALDVVPSSTRKRVDRIMVLEKHAELLETMIRRCKQFLPLESKGDGGMGLPIPEVRANMELLSRMFEQHLKIQQSAGMMPAAGRYSNLKGMPLGEDDPGDDRGFSDFVKGIVALQGDQFAELLALALGPPPDKSVPKVIDAKAERIVQPGERG